MPRSVVSPRGLQLSAPIPRLTLIALAHSTSRSSNRAAARTPRGRLKKEPVSPSAARTFRPSQSSVLPASPFFAATVLSPRSFPLFTLLTRKWLVSRRNPVSSSVCGLRERLRREAQARAGGGWSRAARPVSWKQPPSAQGSTRSEVDVEEPRLLSSESTLLGLPPTSHPRRMSTSLEVPGTSPSSPDRHHLRQRSPKGQRGRPRKTRVSKGTVPPPSPLRTFRDSPWFVPVAGALFVTVVALIM